MYLKTKLLEVSCHIYSYNFGLWIVVYRQAIYGSYTKENIMNTLVIYMQLKTYFMEKFEK